MAPLMTDDVPALIDANAAKDTDTHAVDTQIHRYTDTDTGAASLPADRQIRKIDLDSLFLYQMEIYNFCLLQFV